MSGADRLSSPSPGRLRAAGASFTRETQALHARWNQPGAGPKPFPATWTLGFALILVAAVAGLGYMLDIPARTGAGTLPPDAIAFFQFVTQFGDSAYVLVPAGLIVIASGMTRGLSKDRMTDALAALAGQRALYVFVAVALAGIFTQVGKHILSRPRPPLFDTYGAFHLEWFALKSAYASFPSGHAATAFAAAVALGLLVPRARWWLLAVALLIAASRVAIRAHYVSDVVAGAALGAAAAILVARLFARRRIAFCVANGQVLPRGRGLIGPALRQWTGQRR